MADATATVLGALIGFVGGMVVARSTFRQKADELFLSGLQYLAGGSQNRNLGIAALGLAWESKRHRKHIAQLLVGTALYLLLESKQDDAAHEKNNLRRLMALILAAKSSGDLQRSDGVALAQAIDAKLESGAGNRPGLFLTNEILEEWRACLGKAG